LTSPACEPAGVHLRLIAVRRAAAATAASLLVAPLLAACGGSSAPEATPPSPALQPLALIGSWRLRAPGETADTSLILAGDGLRLFRRCGALDGAWVADRSGLFIGQIQGGDQTCFLGSTRNPKAEWMDTVTGYRVDGADRLLLDASGGVVARLSPGAHPTAGPNRLGSDASPPVVTPAVRESFRQPMPLPHDVRPAVAADLLGRWQPLGAGRTSSRAFVEFGAAGVWSGSDGCNGAGGRYAVGPQGEFLVISGAQTLIGCHNSPVPDWVARARRVGTDGGTLLFYDGRRRLLGRCARS
jgi:hypothetical protein